MFTSSFNCFYLRRNALKLYEFQPKTFQCSRMLYSSFFCVCLRGLSVKFIWCFQVLYTFADWLCGFVKDNNLPLLSLFVTSCLLFSVLFYVLLRNPCGVVAGSSQKTVILGRSPQGGWENNASNNRGGRSNKLK